MQELFVILLFLLGLVLILRGGDYLVDACLMLSKITGISQVVIGATLVSVATALPEICVSLIAVANYLHYLAVGNALGSMICNIALVLGMGIILSPQKIQLKEFKNKAVILMFLIFLLFTLCINLKIGLVESVLLLSMGVLFLYINFREAKFSMEEKKLADKTIVTKKEIATFLLKFIFGANLLVKNSEILGEMMGVNTEIIGFTVIAFSTCLPELVTTITALRKQSMELALGNIVGANIMNITLLFGLGALLSGNTGLQISKNASFVLIPLLIFMTLLLILPILATKKIWRIQGIFLLIIYIAYIAIILST